MTSKHGLTLAIYPNSIGFGYAVVRSPREPIDCGVVRILPPNNSKALERITSLIAKYEPTLIVLQHLQGKNSYKSSRVKQLIRVIQKFATQGHIPVALYTREQIRMVFAEFDGEAKSKFQIAHVIGKYMKEYRHRLPKERKAWDAEDYNQGLFDSLSLVITHFYLTE